MWIKSRDNKQLIDGVSVKIEKQFKNYYLIGKIKGQSLASDVVLAKYSSIEDAQRELKHIEEAILENKSLYQVK